MLVVDCRFAKLLVCFAASEYFDTDGRIVFKPSYHWGNRIGRTDFVSINQYIHPLINLPLDCIDFRI